MATVTSSAAAPPARATMLSTLVRNITSSWAAVLVSTLVSLVLSPIVVDALGSVYYGIWSLLMQLTGYLWLFDFGVRESVIKYVAQYQASNDRSKVETTVRTGISVYTVVTLAAMAAVCVISIALPYVFNIPEDAIPAARVAALVSGATVAQSFLSNVFIGVLMGLHRFYLVSRVSVVFLVARAVATYVLIQYGYGLVALSVLHLAVSLVNALVIVHYCRIYLPDIPLRPIRPAREEVLRLFNYAKYVMISNIGDKIVFATDALVIGMFMPIAAITPYAIAGTLIQQMRTIVATMGAVFNPLASQLHVEQGDRAVDRMLRTGAKGAMLVGLPLCIGFITLGETFVALWMGDQYAKTAGQVMTVLAMGFIVGLPYYTISGVLFGLGEHRVIALSRVVEGAMNLTLSVVLINVVGLVGVAWGTAIPHMIIAGWILPRHLPRIFPFDRRSYYLEVYARTLVAATPFAMACWLIAAVVKPATLLAFFAWGALSLVAYLIPVVVIALSRDERRHALRLAHIHA